MPGERPDRSAGCSQRSAADAVVIDLVLVGAVVLPAVQVDRDRSGSGIVDPRGVEVRAGGVVHKVHLLTDLPVRAVVEPHIETGAAGLDSDPVWR